MSLSIKRVYDPAAPEDGFRILVDRLWPRGLSKEKAAVDLWLKTIAPSTELRQWFDHDPVKWPEFQKRYAAELAGHADEIAQIRKMARRRRVTLVYGAHDVAHNNAVVIAGHLGRSA